MRKRVLESLAPNELKTKEFLQKLYARKENIEKLIETSVLALGKKTELRDACEYALKNGGKRFRPALVFMIAEALDRHSDVSHAALAVEFFHTASLIADDLPCMDNDDERRNMPSLHKVYGETVALLASYSLIAAGYECLAKNVEAIKNNIKSDRICVLALENVTHNAGLSGATGGQFLDIFPPDLSLETLKEAIHKKTVALFEIAFVLGWLYGGGDEAQLGLVKKAASHFGMAFQIADDIGDVEQDQKNERKVNIAGVCGKERAYAMFYEEIAGYLQILKMLKLDTPELKSMICLLTGQVEEQLQKDELKTK